MAIDLARRMKKYDQITKDFSKFVKTDLLSKVLDTKVDFTHLDKVQKLKVSLDEF